MESILIHPQSKKQVKAFEHLAKAFNLPFELTNNKSAYNHAFVAKMERSKKQAEKGQTVKIKLDDIWK